MQFKAIDQRSKMIDIDDKISRDNDPRWSKSNDYI